jgi:glyoxylase-like metal-dependent hydrolase (beta-lactamase superfamily II)
VAVDPSRDVDKYLAVAASYSLKVAAIIETHLHADFVSGHMDLGEATGV